MLIIVGLLWFFLKDSSQNTTPLEEPVDDSTSLIDPLTVTMEFYDLWLGALQSTTTDPYQSGLTNLPIISAEMRAQIEQKHAEHKEGDLDPVLCQTTTPKRVGGKVIYADGSEAQIMMLARGGEIKSPYQAIVTLEVVTGEWQINKIECVQGETAPTSEFDFDRSGYLLKQSLLPPLNPENWHLIHQENEQPGHATPLSFDASSTCVSLEGIETVCDTSLLIEATKVNIKANMGEQGATVKFLTFE